MNTAAKIAVARDSAVLAPRAPKTVPDAPAPKPAPASAPLPRCSRTSAMIEMAENTWMIVKAMRNMFQLLYSGVRLINSQSCEPEAGSLVRPGRSQDREKFVGLERGAADEPAVDIGHREQLRRITGLDAAAIQNARF